MSTRKWSKNTFGWARAEVLAPLLNAVFLCALCFSILMVALHRFYDPDEIHQPFLVLAVGSVGFVVNIIGLLLFKGHGHSHGVGSQGHSPKGVKTKAMNMNMHRVFLHVFADTLGSVIVIISASIIAFTNWEYSPYVDPTLSLIMVCIITLNTWPLLFESSMILLESVPKHIQVESLQKKLLDNISPPPPHLQYNNCYILWEQIDGVLAVHEFHIWQLDDERIIATAHFQCSNLTDYMQIAGKVKEFFHNEGIHSTTLQPEFINLDDNVTDIVGSADCFLDCPPQQKSNCLTQTCCGAPNRVQKKHKALNSRPETEPLSRTHLLSDSKCLGSTLQ